MLNYRVGMTINEHRYSEKDRCFSVHAACFSEEECDAFTVQTADCTSEAQTV